MGQCVNIDLSRKYPERKHRRRYAASVDEQYVEHMMMELCVIDDFCQSICRLLFSVFMVFMQSECSFQDVSRIVSKQSPIAIEKAFGGGEFRFSVRPSVHSSVR